jgi:hypothetical protein
VSAATHERSLGYYDRSGVPDADGKFAVGRLPLEKLLGNRSAIDIKGPNGSVY